ncbi:MAG: polymer-forming cytoskeletal protein [Anaerolineales bacterium]|nr:MAG: polymer-forming cytoskeletal protein [Anaerolineales bacterium]
MIRSKWFAALLLAAVAVLAVPGVAFAAPAELPAFDEIVLGRDFTLEAGRTLNGDLVVLGGSLVVEERAQVNGQVAVIGGDADISGSIDGDLVVVGGAATLNAGALLSGDLIVPTGQAEISPSAIVSGSTVYDVQFPWGDGEWSRNPGMRDFGNVPQPQTIIREVGRGVWAEFVWMLFRSVAMATVALLLVLFMERHMRRVAGVITEQPPMAAGVGLLAVLAVGAATVMLSITLIFIPVAVLLPFLLVTAWAFGWISLGLEVGRRMADAFKAVWSPALQALLGTFTLTFATGAVGWVPCLGWLLGVVVGLAGLGAVVLTRFGGQDYPGPGAVVAPAATPPALPAPRKRAAAKTAATKKSTRRS